MEPNLKDKKPYSTFLLKKNQQDLNYFFSHAFLFNTKSDFSSLTFKLQPKTLETYILNG